MVGLRVDLLTTFFLVLFSLSHHLQVMSLLTFFFFAYFFFLSFFPYLSGEAFGSHGDVVSTLSKCSFFFFSFFSF
jgi:hypothetical protein